MKASLQPKVSVLMVSYQQKDFIAESIDSVLAQDYPGVEIVIGDDGSTDGTQDMLKAYQRQHSQIRVVLSDVNAGITANCNKVFRQCTGDYIAFQSGDDVWLPGKLSSQVEYMENNPDCSICYHALDVFDNESGVTVRKYNNANNPPRSGSADVSIRYGCFNGAVTNMVRRCSCPEYGFDARIPIASDWLFWVEILMKGGEIHYLDKTLARYRIHNNNTSSYSSERIVLNMIDHLNSANIILLNHPEYLEDVCYRVQQIYREMSRIDAGNNHYYDVMSGKYRWNFLDSLRMMRNRLLRG